MSDTPDRNCCHEYRCDLCHTQYVPASRLAALEAERDAAEKIVKETARLREAIRNKDGANIVDFYDVWLAQERVINTALRAERDALVKALKLIERYAHEIEPDYPGLSVPIADDIIAIARAVLARKEGT